MEYELYHHGIKGMRWGIRRYQNKDGSLTPAGEKRRARLEAEINQLSTKRTSNAGAEVAPRKKLVSEMTDDELRDRTNRMQLESNYYNAAKNLAAANPRKVSKGEKFMNSLVNDVVAPAAKNAGRQWLENFMKDKLGLNKEDPIKRLESKARKLELEKKIKDLNKEDPNADLKKEYERLDWEKKIKDIKKGDDNSDLNTALEFFRNVTVEDRQEMKDAAAMFENLDKIRKKGVSKD